MSPLRITRNNNQVQGIATSHRRVVLPDGSTVFWTQSVGRMWVQDPDGRIIRDLFLPKIGDHTDWDISVHIPQIEVGEPSTPVSWPIRAERIK